MIVLGIETSCDETAASIIEGVGDGVTVLSNVVSSQIEIHKKYGGVVPEVAAREHVLSIVPVVEEAILKAGITTPAPSSFGHSPSGRGRLGTERKIDAIAVTVGPGLITSLLCGVETAKSLAVAWGVKTVAVNHIEGHIYANFIRSISNEMQNQIQFPAVILTVSGGHTNLVLMKGHGELEIIGETLDDAAGEAFDKGAKLLGLEYPGGPSISREAEKFKLNIKSEMLNVVLPRPMLNKKNFDFSFSGLKTALLYLVQKDSGWKKHREEYAHELQQSVVDVLVGKTLKAAKKYDAKTVLLSGGVAANKELRSQLAETVNNAGLNFHMPELAYTTDNASMIAAAGYFKARAKKYAPWQELKADPNYELKAE